MFLEGLSSWGGGKSIAPSQLDRRQDGQEARCSKGVGSSVHFYTGRLLRLQDTPWTNVDITCSQLSYHFTPGWLEQAAGGGSIAGFNCLSRTVLQGSWDPQLDIPHREDDLEASGQIMHTHTHTLNGLF